MGTTQPSEREKSILDTLVILCRRLHEANAKFIRQLMTLLFGDRSLIRPIRFVADQNLIDTF